MARTKALSGRDVRIAVNPHTQPYWDATRERRLVAACCGACDRFRMPYLAYCPHCLSQEVNWTEITGPGAVYSFTFYPHPERAFEDGAALAPALVEFQAAPGIRYAGDLEGLDTSQIRIGMAVEVDWSFTDEGWGLLVFRPSGVAQAPSSAVRPE